MTRPTNPGRTAIDLETWNRRVVFEFFKDFDEPYHGVCVRVDCTATFDYAKQHGLSVFLTLMHRSLVAARQVEQLRTRVERDTVWLYDHLNGGSAVGRPNGTIGFGFYQFHESLQEFVAEASLELQRVRGRADLEHRPANGLIRYSVLPWFDFTSISHARQFKHADSAPRITFDKITEIAGRRSMPSPVAAPCPFRFMCIMDSPMACMSPNISTTFKDVSMLQPNQALTPWLPHVSPLRRGT